MTPAGIYVSVPFCRQKCTYCNFASDVHPSSSVSRYVSALTSEILKRSELWQSAGLPEWPLHAADTIYFGGGTPGMLSAKQLAAVLGSIRGSFRIAIAPETTIEASPENATAEAAREWYGIGINRVSMGVQSMDAGELRAVGRRDTARTVADAVDRLRAAGIADINIDLIAGLPLQTAASWRRSLDQTLALEPAHVSVYMLEVDDDSRLGHELMASGERYHARDVPCEEDIAAFYCMALERLDAAGIEQYEISNFARPGFESRHNMKYWSDAPYFGFGAGAHSYAGERRWENMETLADYIGSVEGAVAPVAGQTRLDARQKLEERFFLGLRRRQGISLARLHEEFDGGRSAIPPVSERFARPIREFCDAGWLEQAGGQLRLTRSGMLFSNEVFAGFMEEST